MTNHLADESSPYRLLEEEIIPTYYDDRKRWVSIMQQAILTGSKFTAARMVHEYRERYYTAPQRD